jgi:hypothetical protein
MDGVRSGRHRARRKVRHDFRAGRARSWGTRAAESQVALGQRQAHATLGVGRCAHPQDGTQTGGGRRAPHRAGRSQIRVLARGRAALSPARPGRAGEIRSSRPAVSLTTSTFTAGAAWVALLSLTRSRYADAVSDTTSSGSVPRTAGSRPRARSASRSMTAHAGVGGAHEVAEAGRDLREGVVPAQATRRVRAR